MGERLERVTADGAATVLLCGEPGIGKTSLLDAFVDAHPELERVAVGRCRSQDDDPFGPWRPLVAATSGGELPASLGQVVAPGRAASHAEAHARRFQGFAELADLVFAGIGAAPTLLAVDDVHWGLGPLHDFLLFFVDEMERRRRLHRLMLVLVTRVLPPPHTVARVLAQLERGLRVSRFDLGPLDDGAIGRIVEDAVGATPTSAYHDLAQRSARGNPLLAQTVVKVLDQRGISPAIRVADRRTWGELRFPLPSEDPVVAWVEGLAPDVRVGLGRAAVLGVEWAGDAHLAVGASAQDLQAGLDVGLLSSDGTTTWFAHSLFREVLYDELAADERRAAHLAAARLGGDPAAPPAVRAVAVGRHYLAAGELAPPTERFAGLREAGQAALGLNLWTEAAVLLEAARATALPGLAVPVEAALHTALGQAHYFDHDFGGASAALRRAVELAEAAGLEDLWASALFLLLMASTTSSDAAWRSPGDEGLAQRFLASARDPADRALILLATAEAHITAGRVEDAIAPADEAIELARAAGDAGRLALALYARAYADMTALRMREGLDRVRDALAVAQRADHWFPEDLVRARLLFPLLATGELEEADELAEVSITTANARREHANLALAESVRATAALLRGDFASADEHVEAAERATRRSSYLLADLFVAPTALLNRLYRNEVGDAAAVARDWPSLTRSARAALASVVDGVGRGGPPPGPQLLRRPSTLTQVSAGFLLAAVDAALSAGGDHDLDEVAGLVDEWRADGLEFAASYPTSLTRLRAEVHAATGELGEAGRLFDEAVRRLERAGAHTETARALAGWARLEARRPGGEDHARALTGRALGLARRVGLDPGVLGLRHPVEPARGGPPGPDWRVVMVTDVVGSTSVSRDLGDVTYFELVMRHHHLVRSCLDRWEGHEFSESGDGLLAWFASTEQATFAAADIQTSVAESPPTEPPLHVKVALSGGEPLFHGGRPYGLVLNRAARLAEAAEPGQIVADEAVTAQLGSGLVTLGPLLDLRGIGPNRVGIVDASKVRYQRPSRRALP